MPPPKKKSKRKINGLSNNMVQEEVMALYNCVTGFASLIRQSY